MAELAKFINTRYEASKVLFGLFLCLWSILYTFDFCVVYIYVKNNSITTTLLILNKVKEEAKMTPRGILPKVKSMKNFGGGHSY